MKQNFFITGGTGSFAKKFSSYLIKKKIAKKIIIFSRDEYKQMSMKNLPFVKSNKKIFRFYIGDVRDKNRLRWAIQDDTDVVIHSAALKQVPATEYNPFETVMTNVIGSQNLIEICIEKNIKKNVLISTDKAVSPINLYGSTKLTAEKLFISANVFKGKKRSKFSVIRYGNVMGSRGSVIPVFLEQNRHKTNPFTVTDKKMTRFNITMDQSISLVLFALNNGKGSEIFVPKIPSYKIIDVAKAINPNCKIKIVGIRPGEKIHEEMITESDSYSTFDLGNCYAIVNPSNGTVLKYYINKKKFRKVPENFSYNSGQNKENLTVKQLKNLINKI